MNDIAHRLRESAKETFYDPLKSELNEAASHIEKLEAALQKIDRSECLHPHDIVEIARKVLTEGKDD